jgi:hypothetical protein
MSSRTYYCENFSGCFFRNQNNGRHYLIAGETDTRISEVEGLETVRTGSAKLTLSEADQAKAVDVAAHLASTATGAKQLTMRRMTNLKVDGQIREWKFDDAASIDADAGRTAKFSIGYDDENLYTAFDVKDDSPMRNAGSDFAMLFKTGDTCEIMLATKADADLHRTKAEAGDVRLLFSEMDGQPIAVLYEPVARVGEKKAERVFSSPTGSETFARVVQIPDAKIVIKRRAGGYVLEAAVPLAELGFHPKAASTFRGDVGVLFSTPGGSSVARRSYFFNQDTQITQDLPSEARLAPANWGEINVE